MVDMAVWGGGVRRFVVTAQEHRPEPVTLGPGQMTQKVEKAELRWRDRQAPKLILGKPLTFPQEGASVVVRH